MTGVAGAQGNGTDDNPFSAVAVKLAGCLCDLTELQPEPGFFARVHALVSHKYLGELQKLLELNNKHPGLLSPAQTSYLGLQQQVLHNVPSDVIQFGMLCVSHIWLRRNIPNMIQHCKTVLANGGNS